MRTTRHCNYLLYVLHKSITSLKKWYNLGTLPQAIAAYKQRMGIEEMFRDCKAGGYNLKGTGLTADRLIKMILLMTISYSCDLIEDTIVKKKHLQKYVSRAKEPQRTYRRRSTFGSGNDSQQWMNYLEKYTQPVEELMKLTRKLLCL